MSEFNIITTESAIEWNAKVKQFEKYEVFYLCDYVRAFEMLGKNKAILMWYDDGETKAMNVAFLRDVANEPFFENKIPHDKYFDLQSPYGYGGMIIEGKDTLAVWNAYNRLCMEKNIICEFVRFSLFSNAETYYVGKVETRTHNVVRNLEISYEDMLMDFEHKVRKNIKKAQRNGLELIVDEEGYYLEDFLKIYYDTMDRNDAKNEYYFPRSFFEQFISMKENAAWFHIKKDNKIVATELVIYNEKNCYSYLGGTYSEFFEFRPNELLKVGIMKWAKEKGIKNFVLGGGYGSDDGIFQYKKSFSPNGIVNFYIGYNIMNPNLYNELVALRTKEPDFNENTMYFPKYRG